MSEQATKASEECKSCKSDTSKQKEIKERELLQEKAESNGLLDKLRSITGLKKDMEHIIMTIIKEQAKVINLLQNENKKYKKNIGVLCR